VFDLEFSAKNKVIHQGNVCFVLLQGVRSDYDVIQVYMVDLAYQCSQGRADMALLSHAASLVILFAVQVTKVKCI
jgi:hypothetical protein